MNNKNGFSLIEAMMYLVVSSVAALAMLTMCMTSLKSSVNISNQSEYSNMQDTIRMLISNPVQCPKTILTTDLNSVNLAGQVIKTNVVLSSGITLTRIQLSVVAKTPNPNEFSALLNLGGIKNPSALGPAVLKSASIPVTYVTNGSTKIIACSLTSNAVVLQPSPTPTPSPSTAAPAEQYDCYKAGGNWVRRGNSSNYSCEGEDK